MSTMNSSQFTDLVEPINNTIFDGEYAKWPEEWSRIFTVQGGKRARYQETAVMFGFGTAVEKPEGGAIATDFGGIAYRVRAVFKVFGLGFSITEEMIEDSEAIDLGAKFSRELAKALQESKEIYHADIFNKAETAGYELGDGATLLSASHPYAIGGVWSNRLASPADLSEASLELLLTQMRLAKDDRANPIRLNPKNIVVAPKNEYVAIRLLRSTNQSGTANNDVNAIRSLGRLPTDPMVMTRLTQEDAYFIHTDAEHGLMHYRRRAVKKGMEGDFATGNMHYKATERYVALAEGARCLYGSLGI